MGNQLPWTKFSGREEANDHDQFSEDPEHDPNEEDRGEFEGVLKDQPNESANLDPGEYGDGAGHHQNS